MSTNGRGAQRPPSPSQSRRRWWRQRRWRPRQWRRGERVRKRQTARQGAVGRAPEASPLRRHQLHPSHQRHRCQHPGNGRFGGGIGDGGRAAGAGPERGMRLGGQRRLVILCRRTGRRRAHRWHLRAGRRAARQERRQQRPFTDQSHPRLTFTVVNVINDGVTRLVLNFKPLWARP